MITCSNCGAENQTGQKFCGECGTALAATCSSCGAANAPGQKFCGECGTPLGSSTDSAPAVAVERRLVSVLFADLVGFTPLSEDRDAEEVRDLLSQYFEVAADVIGRYGGVVEKFIGDAVMAVWGTPVAQEDDAERAVRAALELVAAVSAFGGETGMPELGARAAVLTGEAAVNLGAAGQGMVAGDLVNAASRVQGAADPHTVLVGDPTRRATEAAIAYADAGLHELKGKADAMQLWRALRVTAGRAGGLKSQGLEPPFVGRDRELRLSKELFHASADEHKAHLLSITGIAGIGKSRLAWELYKYLDGISQDVAWHRGRCLAYGDGVTYWALAEMVRMHAAIAEGEDDATAWSKLDAALESAVEDAEERAWIRPRVAQLLSLESTLGSRAGRAVRRVAALLRTARGARPGRARLRGHAMGRRAAARVRRVSARVVAQSRDPRGCARPPRVGREQGAVGGRAQERDHALCSSPFRPRRWRRCSTASCRASPTTFARRSSSARKAFPSTPSRLCACCSTVVCWSRWETSTAPRARSRRSKCRRRSRR